MIMMSVMPGRGSGTKELSTIDTRKTPKIPKLKSRCRKGLRALRGTVAAWDAKAARYFAVLVAAARSFISDYDVDRCCEVAGCCRLMRGIRESGAGGVEEGHRP